MRTNRFDINRMTRSNTGGGGGATGGGGSYTLPLAADGVRGGVQLGFTTDATARKYAVQLDNEKAYVYVPWTDHYAWGDISDKPATATRWPSWDEVTSKPSSFTPSAHNHAWEDIITGVPATATRWPSWSEVTGKPTSKTAWGQTFWNSSSEPVSISGDMSDVGNIAFAASGKNIGGLLYFDTANGRLGIGTSSPRAALDISGGLVTTGDQTISSDIRMKKVIDFDLPINVDEIADAPVIHFTLKNDKKQSRRIGSVAQYWKKFMPEAVPTGDDGMLSMGYGSIALVSAVALAREVVTLKQEVSKLQKLIRNQEKK